MTGVQTCALPIWDDTDVQARLQELGIQLNTTDQADQQQPVAPAAGQQPPGTSPEQVVREMDKSQDPPGRDGGIQFPPGPKVSKKDIKAIKKDPVKHLSDLLAKEYEKKKMKEEVGQIDENSPTHIVYFRHPTLAKMRGIEVNANDENDAHKKAYKKLKELEPFHHKNMKDYDVEKLSEEVVAEGRMKDMMFADAESMSSEAFCERYGDEDWVKEIGRAHV